MIEPLFTCIDNEIKKNETEEQQMDVEQPADSSAGAAKRGTNDESNARESVVEPTRIVINETVNQMRANSTRQPMQAKVPSLSL